MTSALPVEILRLSFCIDTSPMQTAHCDIVFGLAAKSPIQSLNVSEVPAIQILGFAMFSRTSHVCCGCLLHMQRSPSTRSAFYGLPGIRTLALSTFYFSLEARDLQTSLSKRCLISSIKPTHIRAYHLYGCVYI